MYLFTDWFIVSRDVDFNPEVSSSHLFRAGMFIKTCVYEVLFIIIITIINCVYLL